MTIREVVEDLLAGRGGDLDPAAVLEGYGFGDLSPEALSTALSHFAERSPLEVADTLAPLVSRLSDVPFLEGDLPADATVESLLADGGEGLLEALSALDSSGLDTDDPTAFDTGFDTALDGLTDAAGLGDGSLDEAADGLLDALDPNTDLDPDLGNGFGLGDDADDALARAEAATDAVTEEPLDDGLGQSTDVQEGLGSAVETALHEAGFDGDDLLGDLGEQLDLPDDLDPGALDFDLD